ncbi:B-box domain protein 30 [Glycine soja]
MWDKSILVRERKEKKRIKHQTSFETIVSEMKKCELCKVPARIFCESDQASLCWDCDAKVHSANFLVARHVRTLLCRTCRSPTPWKASGASLAHAASVCDRCAAAEETEESEAGNDDEPDTEDDDDVDNQVVPWSSTPPPPPPSSSSGSECSECKNNVASFSASEQETTTSSLKRQREDDDDASSDPDPRVLRRVGRLNGGCV